MRRTTSPPTRAIWALLALVQLAAAVVGPMADAALESSAERVAHVESESGAECGVHHDHLFCQNCRSVALEARHGPATCEALIPAQTLGHLSASPVDLPATAPGLSRPVGSRAPPRG